MLLAFASLYKPCRPYLPRYFSACINIPSDWIAVADFVQTFAATEGGISEADVYLSARNYRKRVEENANEQKTKTHKLRSTSSGHGDPGVRRNLPAILRKVMTAKFSEFDEYQLAKYNKNKKRPKPNHNIKVSLSFRETDYKFDVVK